MFQFACIFSGNASSSEVDVNFINHGLEVSQGATDIVPALLESNHQNQNEILATMDESGRLSADQRRELRQHILDLGRDLYQSLCKGASSSC